MNPGTQTGRDHPVGPGPPSMIQADRDQFKQVLLNVMQNAIEATPTGGLLPSPSPNRLARGVEPGLEVAVTDHGQGISPAHLAARVRTVFHQRQTTGNWIGVGDLPQYSRRPRRGHRTGQ